MSEENEAIFRRWVEEVWVKGKEKTIDELFDDYAAADYTYNLINRPIQGRENYKKFVRFIRGLYTDIHIKIEQIASDENKVIAYCTLQANRRFIGTNNSEQPQLVNVSGLCQVIIENGKIVRTWSNIDLFGTQEENKDGV